MTLATNAPPTWDTLLTTTLNNYRKTLTDNVFGGRVLLDYLQSKGRVRMVDGGMNIVEPLLLGPGEADSYSQWQQIVVNPVGGISAAVFPWKQIYATIIISGLEEAQNNGKEQMINLLETKVMQAEESLKGILSLMLWGRRGANVKDFDPLTNLVDATLIAGGITPPAVADATMENLWRSPTFNVATGTGIGPKGEALAMPTGVTAPLNGQELESILRKMFMLASDGGKDHVDAIFASGDWFEAYEASLTPQVRYTDTTKANLGFQNLMFKNVPIYWDPDAPAGTALGLNSKYIGLAIHSDRNFEQSPFTGNLSGSTASTATSPSPAATALDARVSFITTYGNTTVRERRRHFKITGATFGP